MAGLVLLIAGVQIFLVNRRFLPKAVRPPLWREIGLLTCSGFLPRSSPTLSRAISSDRCSDESVMRGLPSLDRASSPSGLAWQVGRPAT